MTQSNGTTFTATYERISKKKLSRNMRVKSAQKIGPRNRNKSKMGPGPTKTPKKE